MILAIGLGNRFQLVFHEMDEMGERAIFHGFNYPLVNIQKAIENGHRNSEFSHETWWFSIAMLYSLPEGNMGFKLSWEMMWAKSSFISHGFSHWFSQFWLVLGKFTWEISGGKPPWENPWENGTTTKKRDIAEPPNEELDPENPNG